MLLPWLHGPSSRLNHRGHPHSEQATSNWIFTQTGAQRLCCWHFWPGRRASWWMVVHRSSRNSCASRPVGIFPHGPIQGDAPCDKNHPGCLPTAVIQHPMGSRFWRIARRTLISGLAVIWGSHLCMVAAAASNWLHR